MSNDNYEEIFAAARQLPQAERERYVTETCADQEEQEHVLALLQKSAKADGFFGELGAPPHVHEASIVEATGDSIGSYKLLQKLGEGGFGVVFMAEQRQAITRRVALKIIKQGMDTRQVIARFEAERQALAMMDHANIARVFDAGTTESGRPYFAMELVEGEPITEFCDAKAYDTQQRLELFLEVCAAVNHAHQKGIIHRDLKPSNILVGLDGDTPVVKVIDFGIAKAIQQDLAEQTLLTRHEQFLGTPAYVSPEQASLSPIDVDTRSDIYSLGVILYELLAGRAPIDTRELQSAGFDEMRRLICEKETPKPSTRLNSCEEKERQSIASKRHTEAHKLGLLLKGDLDWIVLKCLEKDRHRRYETANALASDIRNFQRDEPVSAVAPSPGYRLRKLVRRNRAAFGAAAAVMLALVAALGISIAALLSEKEARQEQEAERNRAEASRKSAQQITDLLQRALGSIDPEVAQGRDTTLLRELLDQMAVRIENELAIDTEEGIELRLTVGRVYLALAQSDEAKAVLNTALAGARGARNQTRIVEVLVELARSEADAFGGSSGSRKKLLAEAVRLSEEINGRSHAQTLVAKSRFGLALGGERGRELIREAMDLGEQELAEDDPARTIIFGNLNESLRPTVSLREHVAMLGELAESERSSHGDRHPRRAFVLSLLAHHLCRLAELEDSNELREQALDIGKQADDLMSELHQPGVERRIRTAWILAQVHVASGDLESARSKWQIALDEQGRAGKAESIFGRYARAELAWMLSRRGHEVEGRRLAMAFAKDDLLPRWITRFWVDLAVAFHEPQMAEAELVQLTGGDVETDDEQSTSDWMKLAAFHLHTGNWDAYDEVRTRMVERYGDSDSTEALRRTAKVFFIAPVPPESPVTEKALGIAHRSLGATTEFSHRNPLPLGMAEFRTGHIRAAETLLRSASEEAGGRGIPSQAILASFRSMAALMAGEEDHAGQARSFLEEGESLIGSMPPETLALNGNWHSLIFAKQALEEARGIVDRIEK